MSYYACKSFQSFILVFTSVFVVDFFMWAWVSWFPLVFFLHFSGREPLALSGHLFFVLPNQQCQCTKHWVQPVAWPNLSYSFCCFPVPVLVLILCTLCWLNLDDFKYDTLVCFVAVLLFSSSIFIDVCILTVDLYLNHYLLLHELFGLLIALSNIEQIRIQHEIYPDNTYQASRQVLVVSDLEIRDRLALSKINKFLYQYSSDSIPRQSHASMVQKLLLIIFVF